MNDRSVKNVYILAILVTMALFRLLKNTFTGIIRLKNCDVTAGCK